ncbi:hypothetical protein HD601_005353 [Jiangella mangrovi]|uniref:Uncharacterized protein n=1 Tax=Jiangella mangrovi TaxID=1524084 RepID=A0A7W9GW09_9ACTN|nr:hypothetical protein [Jiangella mangrovi]
MSVPNRTDDQCEHGAEANAQNRLKHG